MEKAQNNSGMETSGGSRIGVKSIQVIYGNNVQETACIISGNERGRVSHACVQYQLRWPLVYPNFRVIFILDRVDHETYSICSITVTPRHAASLPLCSPCFQKLSLFVHDNLSKFIIAIDRVSIPITPACPVLCTTEQELENCFGENRLPAFKLLVTWAQGEWKNEKRGN